MRHSALKPCLVFGSAIILVSCGYAAFFGGIASPGGCTAEGDILQYYQLDRDFGGNAFESQGRKGGVGMIDAKLLILLDDEKNELVNKGVDWVGKSYNDREFVVVSDEGVLSLASCLKIPKSVVIRFTPDEVRYIDYRNSKMGAFDRMHRTP